MAFSGTTSIEGTTIVRLFLLGGPSAILRRIRPVIVDTIQAVPWRWAMPHIFKEYPKVIPSLIKRYASPSIEGISTVARIKAPVPGSSPSTVFHRMELMKSRGKAMPFTDGICLQASATLSLNTTAKEEVARHDALRAAVAQAKPTGAPIPKAHLLEHSPATKAFTSDVSRRSSSWHRWELLGLKSKEFRPFHIVAATGRS